MLGSVALACAACASWRLATAGGPFAARCLTHQNHAAAHFHAPPQSPQGTRRELLRALCQLVNTTSLTLEAALIEVEDSDWHMVAARSGGWLIALKC